MYVHKLFFRVLLFFIATIRDYRRAWQYSEPEQRRSKELLSMGSKHTQTSLPVKSSSKLL